MIARCALVGLVVAACGDPAAHVTLVRANPEGSCLPPGATSLKVTAYAASGEVARAVGLDEVVDIADFPPDTEQLGVEVIGGGGAVAAIGKSPPFLFTELPDDARITVFMTPPGGACPTGAATEARIAPLVARAGDGVLVLGGTDGAGTELKTAEYYDPATATFAPLPLPAVLADSGFVGAALATLPDGRVVISGGRLPTLTVFSPATRTFGESVVFTPRRAFHVAIPSGEGDLLLAGGCEDVAGSGCGGIVRRSSQFYSVADIAMTTVGPALRVARLGAQPFDVGVLADGHRAFVIAGGELAMPGDPLGADRLTLTEDDAVALTGIHAQAALLDGGALLSAFAADADPADGTATVLPPGALAARPIAPAPDRRGVRLIGLEDGRVAGLGGDTGAATLDVLAYDPTTDRWTPRTPGGDVPATRAPVLVRLADGSVLGLGGAPATTGAFVYRDSLIGPRAGSVTVVPASDTNDQVLTPLDPEAAVRTPGSWQLVVPAGLDLARALVGGPRLASGAVEATVHVLAGGVALVAQHAGSGEELVAELAPEADARLVRRAAGATAVVCTGARVRIFDPAIAATARLEVAGTTARLTLDGAQLLACDLGASAPGAWGLAALGAGARVTVDTVTVAR